VARLLADGIRNANLVELPGIGHLTPNEAPQEFNRLVREFLDAQEPTTRGTGS